MRRPGLRLRRRRGEVGIDAVVSVGILAGAGLVAWALIADRAGEAPGGTSPTGRVIRELLGAPPGDDPPEDLREAGFERTETVDAEGQPSVVWTRRPSPAAGDVAPTGSR